MKHDCLTAEAVADLDEVFAYHRDDIHKAVNRKPAADDADEDDGTEADAEIEQPKKPHVAADGYRLGLWVQVQRREEDDISAERKARLNALGFIWDVLADQWEEGFQHLQAFVDERGHCRVPVSHIAADGYRLGQWVKVQRRRADRISAERKARLDALGFEWAPKTNRMVRSTSR
jgi:Helicase associated domain